MTGPVAELTRDGARFSDGREEAFGAIILATGFRPALTVLGNAIRLDECGFARRQGRVRSADHPDLYFVGHTYDLRGALRNIAADSRLAGRLIANALEA
jgi:putative flavoprotein involved in K+ transport